jgi:hypothetical protein
VKFYGTVDQAGKIKWDMPLDVATWAKDHKGKRVEVVFRQQETLRTARQNNYYWGAVLPVLTDFYNDTRSLIFPVHQSVVHEEMKKAWLGVDEEGRVKHSKNLSAVQFSEMVEAIRDFLATKVGVDRLGTKGYYVPSPEEWMKGERQ